MYCGMKRRSKTLFVSETQRWLVVLFLVETHAGATEHNRKTFITFFSRFA
jgi:hypothetical protein